MYIHNCIIPWIHACMHACMHACIHTYIHTNYIYVHTYIHTYIHTYMHADMHPCMLTCIHTYVHACSSVRKCGYMHMYIRLYIYVDHEPIFMAVEPTPCIFFQQRLKHRSPGPKLKGWWRSMCSWFQTSCWPTCSMWCWPCRTLAKKVLRQYSVL